MRRAPKRQKRTSLLACICNVAKSNFYFIFKEFRDFVTGWRGV
jgi:hypothetical protein